MRREWSVVAGYFVVLYAETLFFSSLLLLAFLWVVTPLVLGWG